MKRERIKFPWDLYWENKTYKLKRSIHHILKRFKTQERSNSAENGPKLSGFSFPKLSHPWPSPTIFFCSSSVSAISIFVCCLDCEATSQLGGEKGIEFVLNRKVDAK